MIASAPGKVLWAGEYAVLDGFPAVITAVDRRVTARLAAEPVPLSPFLAAVRDEIAARHGPDRAAVAARVVVDSTALTSGDRKLGLGSSAAATVAATALALGTTAGVHEIAHAAHAAAQAPRGARGSGADVAASVLGGTLLVSGAGDGPLLGSWLPDPQVPWTLLWTGLPADTPALVAQTRALRDRDAAGHAAAMASLAAAAISLAAALAARDPRATIAAVAEGAAALGELAARSGAPLVPPGFATIADAAARLGGAAKPTGAGGGDLVLAVFPENRAVSTFLDAHPGMMPVTLRVELQGVALAADTENA